MRVHKSIKFVCLGVWVMLSMTACINDQSTIPIQGQNCGQIFLAVDPQSSQFADIECFLKAYQACTSATLEYDYNNVDIGYRWGVSIIPHAPACQVHYTEIHHGNAQSWRKTQDEVCKNLTQEWRGIVLHCGSGLKIFPLFPP